MEQTIVESGIILIKYCLNVDIKEQERRIKQRLSDPRKIWKLSPIDIKSYSHWYEHSRAQNDMTIDTVLAPWYIADSNNKKRVRLNIISHILSLIPYEKIPIKK